MSFFPTGPRRRFRSAARRATIVTIAGAAFLALGIGTAFAHVTIDPTSSAAGSYATVTFKVPTESDTASTTALTVTLPTDHPIPSVSARQQPGWSVSMTKVSFDTPVKEGRFTLTEAVKTVTWKADDGVGIPSEQFAQFALSLGPLPDAGSLTFDAAQTYSDGSVVNWNEKADDAGSEPEHPAPVLTISPADASAGSAADGPSAAHDGTSGSDTTAQILGLVALILAAIALLVAAFSLRRRRSAPPAGATPEGATPEGAAREGAAPPSSGPTKAASAGTAPQPDRTGESS